jgi:hypothetical protein
MFDNMKSACGFAALDKGLNASCFRHGNKARKSRVSLVRRNYAPSGAVWLLRPLAIIDKTLA